jgi:hypothetical protein
MPWRRGPIRLSIPTLRGRAIYTNPYLLSRLGYYLNR